MKDLIQIKKLDHKASGPKYLQISDAICKAIVRGDIGAKERLQTETDLAQQLGVERMTVRRGYDVLKKKGVIVRQRGVGSFVSQEAAEILGVTARRRMRHVAFLIPADHPEQVAPHNRFILFDLMAGLSQQLEQVRAHHSQLLIGSRDHIDHALLKDRLQTFDGIVIYGLPGVMPEFSAMIQPLDIPCVSVWWQSMTSDIPCVIYDRSLAMGMVVDHLVEKGHRRIGYLGADDRHERRSKLRSFQYAMGDRHMAFPSKDYLVTDERHTPYTPGAARQGILKRVDQGDLPSAMFVDTDEKAIEVLHALDGRGISVPKDMAVVSYDNIPSAKAVTPSLTAVSTPRRQIGEQAAKLLLEWPAKGPSPASVVLQPELVVRQST